MIKELEQGIYIGSYIYCFCRVVLVKICFYYQVLSIDEVDFM